MVHSVWKPALWSGRWNWFRATTAVAGANFQSLQERLAADRLAAFQSLRADEADFDDSVARLKVVEDQTHGAVGPTSRGAHIESLDDAPAIEADVQAVRARGLAARCVRPFVRSRFYARISGITWP